MRYSHVRIIAPMSANVKQIEGLRRRMIGLGAVD
jgi:hypothetical protein